MKKNNIFKNVSAIIVLIFISTLLVACFPDQEKDWQADLNTFPEITFTGFSPTSGFPGTEVTLTGTNFGDLKQAARIDFNGTEVAIGSGILSYTDTEIVVAVPEFAASGPINLKVWTHETQSSIDFNYIPGAQVNSLSPETGSIGEQIAIVGNNFGSDISAISVFFNGEEANIISLTNTEIIVEVPDSTSGSISVFYDNGLREAVGPNFIYFNPAIVFEDFLEDTDQFGGPQDTTGTQASGFWPSSQPTNSIGSREWECIGDIRSSSAYGVVSPGSGELTIGASRAFLYDISDDSSVGYTKPSELILEANVNLGTFNNNATPRWHRGIQLGYHDSNITLDANSNMHTGFRGIILTPDSNEIFLWDGAASSNTTFAGLERVEIADFISDYDRDANHHLKLVINTSTSQLVSVELDGTPITFTLSPDFSNANTQYMHFAGGSNGGDSKATIFDVGLSR